MRINDLLTGGVLVALVLGGLWAGRQEADIGSLRHSDNNIRELIILHSARDAHNQAGVWIAELRTRIADHDRSFSAIMKAIHRIEDRLEKRRGENVPRIMPPSPQ